MNIDRMNEILDRAEPILARLEERDAMCRLQLEQVGNAMKTLKWLVGIIMIPLGGLLVTNQVQIAQSAKAAEVELDYARKTQVEDAFSYAAKDLSYTIEELSDSVGLRNSRPFMWNMETIEAILNTTR